MGRHGIGASVQVRVYLEGRYVPSAATSLVVQGSVNAPASANINLVPTNTIKHILPGTWVHVFTTDPWDLNPAGDLSDFKLLFEGVVIARGFSRQDDGRTLSIQCADPSIYWADARQFWLNITSAGGGIVDQLAIQTSGGYGRFTTLEQTGTYGYALQKLTQTQEGGEERFLDTMLSVIDDIGNVNPFYTNVRNRFRLTDRVIRAAAGNTEKLFQLNLLGEFLNGLAQRASGQSNLLDVVNQLLSAILHEWVSVVAPPYVKTRVFLRDAFGNIKRNKSTVTRTDRDGSRKVDLFSFETGIDDVVAGMIFKPNVYTLSPPSCNVLFPNMYNRGMFNESFLQEPTRLQMQPQLITQSLQNVTTGLLFLRPTELEVFTAITRDAKRGTRGKRDPDGQFADGAGQTPTYQDYDWSTNEERIRGIVSNFINLGPAPSTLTLTDQGKRTPAGTRSGGMPKYLQNVASYEFYKAKFAARQTGFAGPFNMRPVCGFPILALDDSAANLNMFGYLTGITHSIQSDGEAHTDYAIELPRLADEVDFNRPRFKGGLNEAGELDLDLVRDKDGKFLFEKAFDGINRPPVPEWFSDDYKTIVGLDITYRKFFGEDCRVLEAVLFNDPTKVGKKATTDAVTAGVGYGLSMTVGVAANAIADKKNNTIDQLDAVNELLNRFRKSRDLGREFEQASEFTNRAFTRIDQAFKFVGAAPLEVIDRKKGTEAPVVAHVDFKKHKLATFVGVTTEGFGYAATKEGAVAQTAPTSTSTAVDGTVDAVSGADVAPRPAAGGLMSGAFPVFDTKIHTADGATDKKTRDGLLKSEAAPSDRPRFDGRPQMFDFEFRLWQESLKAAGFTSDGQSIAAGAEQADYFVTEAGATRRATPEEQAAATTKRRAAIDATTTKDRTRKEAGHASPRKTTSMSSDQQAPTGDGVESNEKLPLPQPLSEGQVIQLRRAIIDEYRSELETNRGFTG